MGDTMKTIVAYTASCLILTVSINCASVALADGTDRETRTWSATAAGGSAPAGRTGSVKSNAAPRVISLGWNYFNCDYIWSYRLARTGYAVQIVNTDTSVTTITSTKPNPTTTQMMGQRVCNNSGAVYGVRIINSTTGEWDAIVGY
jgi:hypothetical protein